MLSVEGISGFFRSIDFQSVHADASSVVDEKTSNPRAIMTIGRRSWVSLWAKYWSVAALSRRVIFDRCFSGREVASFLAGERLLARNSSSVVLLLNLTMGRHLHCPRIRKQQGWGRSSKTNQSTSTPVLESGGPAGPVQSPYFAYQKFPVQVPVTIPEKVGVYQ